MKDVADELSLLVRETIPRLEAITATESRKLGPGTWSRKDILGHLIDSALNNHQRFVRASLTGELTFPSYDGDAWVAAQAYRDRPWLALINLWAHLNAHLAHVVARIPGERLAAPCRIGAGEDVTLEFLVRDYLEHLRHHLAQVLDAGGARGGTQPPHA